MIGWFCLEQMGDSEAGNGDYVVAELVSHLGNQSVKGRVRLGLATDY